MKEDNENSENSWREAGEQTKNENSADPDSTGSDRGLGFLGHLSVYKSIRDISHDISADIFTCSTTERIPVEFVMF